MKELIELRHYLHRHPELSNKEHATSGYISEFMAKLSPDEMLDLASTGKAFVFEGREKGQTVLFRAELDALPIAELSELPYASGVPGVSHVCGHDGHMAILAGLGQKIAENRPRTGRAVLLFQPAEEVEQGARDVVNDPAFSRIAPDLVFALHNIPGRSEGEILLKEGSFAAASKGMTIRLTGKSAHAGEPEMGINPARAIGAIIHELEKLNRDTTLFLDTAFTTVIHIQLGSIAFGTSPGYAEIRVTLRAFENADMEKMTGRVGELVREIAGKEKLESDVSFSEVFPATVNHQKCLGVIEKAAEDMRLNVKYLEKPFRWSEDFGYYTERYPGGFFGLGSGVGQPALHNPDYDFPDSLIETGVCLFEAIYRKLCF